ncbi:Tat pathway signal sequence domain protein [Brevundimonas diminuta 470-4]|nr:Tat pathway signal sequence domain protein [Brevundimonas diminuta 470-4]
MINRRNLLLSAAATAAAAPMLAQCAAAAASDADARLNALLDGWFEADIDEAPERATNLGLDKDARAGLSSKLSEAGPDAIRKDREEAIKRWDELKAFDQKGLSEAGALNYAIAAFGRETAAQTARFDYGAGPGRPSPYIVTQLSGAYFSTPDFMDNQHRIEDAAGADAFLSRLEAFAGVLDGETDKIREDAGLGVIAPDFIIDRMLPQIRTLRDTPAADMAMIQSLVRKTGALNLSGYDARAAALVDEKVKPALVRQIEALEAIRPKAVHDAGVWRLPDGEAFYAAGLKSNTTTTLSAKEIHAMGVEQVAEITAEIDGILKSQGMTQGTVGERVQALNKDPAQLFPNTDAGKEDLLKWLNEQVAALEPKLPTVFGRLPKTNVEIRRVPVSIQSGAPGGYYQGPPLDGSRPGAYYINLRDSGNWPKFALPTLTYHEASPGHHLQVALQRESGELPQWRRAGGFSAFNEGWALYAEAVAANDLDAYATDPLGRVGFLMSYLFRAVRLVVDTGIHSERWSRERAVEYMAASGAKPLDASNSEINRYSVWPGQACAYKVGHTVIARLREEAQAKDGFDLRAFHDKVLGSGSLPLAVLEGRMRA